MSIVWIFIHTSLECLSKWYLIWTIISCLEFFQSILICNLMHVSLLFILLAMFERCERHQLLISSLFWCHFKINWKNKRLVKILFAGVYILWDFKKAFSIREVWTPKKGELFDLGSTLSRTSFSTLLNKTDCTSLPFLEDYIF